MKLFNDINYNSYQDQTLKYKLITNFIRTTNLELGLMNFNIYGSSEYEKIKHFLKTVISWYFDLLKKLF